MKRSSVICSIERFCSPPSVADGVAESVAAEPGEPFAFEASSITSDLVLMGVPWGVEGGERGKCLR